MTKEKATKFAIQGNRALMGSQETGYMISPIPQIESIKLLGYTEPEAQFLHLRCSFK